MPGKGKARVQKQVPRQAQRKMARTEKKLTRQERVLRDKKTPSSNGIQTIREAKADPRMGPNAKGGSLVLTTAQNVINQIVELDAEAIQAFALGYVTRSLEKGYQASQSIASNSYWAYQYLCSVLGQFASGSVPAVQQLPYVVLAYGRALSQKSVGMDQGKITYSFKVGTGVVPTTSKYLIGFATYGFNWTIGYLNSAPATVGSFPVLTQTTGTGTDLELANAFAEMNQYLLDRDGPEKQKSPFRLVSLTSKTSLDRDVSSFAFLQNCQGGGANPTYGSGGFMCQANLEVPMFRPFLATLASSTGFNSEASRWGNLVTDVAGDATYIGGMIGHVMKEHRWGMKRAPKFHAIDFWEFVEVMAMWVQGLLVAAMNDPTGQWAATGDKYQCPLTLQEMALLLRNVFMAAFKDTQASVQGCMPFYPENPISSFFVPFTAGSGTCFLESIDMHLPRPLVENIRSLVYRVTRRHAKDEELFIPVLGEWVTNSAPDRPNQADYTYSWSAGGINPNSGSANCFVSDPVFKKRVVVDGKTQWLSATETFIEFVDGNSTSGYVAINNPKQLKALAQLWNDWLANYNLTSYSVKLIQLGTETGVNILYSGNMTRYWVQQGFGRKGEKLEECEKNFIDTRFEKQRYLSTKASPYIGRQAVADSCQSPFLQAPYEQFQNVWILPTVLLQTQGDPFQSTVLPRWQAIMKENFVQNFSSGTDGPTLTSIHASYAAKMVKSKQEVKNEWEDFFDTCDEKGEAGILSGLVGGALSALFPKAAPVINAVADVVPF